MEVTLQIRFHIRWVKTRQRTRVNSVNKRHGKRYRARDLKVVCLIALALSTPGGMGIVDEDAVGADQVRLKGPLERIRVEVAQEDMDEERAIESVLLDSDIGDPFTILAILGGRVAGRVLTGRIHCLFPDHDGGLLVNPVETSSND